MGEDFYISNDIDKMDISLIHGVIGQSYWAKGIPLDTLKRALHNSLCFGVFDAEHRQVAFARIISDYATYAYLADVFVTDEFKGRGLSRKLMEAVVAHPQLQGLRRMTLATRDAHGLYEKFGFKPLSHPDTFMEIWTPGIYQH